MKMLVTMNQIAYFKPETTARRLKKYYQAEGDPVMFLGYLRLIDYLPKLALRAKPLQAELYAKEVREIFLDTPWEQEELGWSALFLHEFRSFFTPVEWRQLKIRYRGLTPFLGSLLVSWLHQAHHFLLLGQYWTQVKKAAPNPSWYRQTLLC